jgi:hypothetical protein
MMVSEMKNSKKQDKSQFDSDSDIRILISGLDYNIQINNGVVIVGNKNNELMTSDKDLEIVKQKIIIPSLLSIGKNWKQDLLNAAETVINEEAHLMEKQKLDQKSVLGHKLGTKQKNGSYYMGISPLTGTDMYLFLKPMKNEINRETYSFNMGTALLTDKRENGQLFKGLKYNFYQLEEEIKDEISTQEGIRRLTAEEWKQVDFVFQAKPDLRETALEICDRMNWVQTASPVKFGRVTLHNLLDGRQKEGNSFFEEAYLLPGYTEAKSKPTL